MHRQRLFHAKNICKVIHSIDLLLILNISSNDDILPLKRTGNLRISLRFAAALPEPTTLIVFAKFPATVTIDKYRGVTDV